MRGWTDEAVERIQAKLKTRGVEVPVSPLVKGNKKLLAKVKRKMKFDHSDLQINCVEIFRLIYPRQKLRLFCVPNGGYRDALNASILSKEGLLPGVLDLFLSIPKNKFGGMYIEIKVGRDRLSDYQIQFIKEMQNDYKCVVIQTVEEFLKEVNDYLKS